MKLRELTLILTGLFIFLSIHSCSVHIEKRRYRKGYYVQVVGNPSIRTTQKQEKESLVQSHFPESNSPIDDSVQFAERDLVPIPNKIHSQNKFVPKPTEDKSYNRKSSFSRHRKHIKNVKFTTSIDVRRKIAWILGGIAIAMVIIYVICGIIMVGPVGAFIFLLGLPVGAVFLAIVALLARYVGLKKELEGKKEDPKPKDKKFLNAAFYTAIISVILIIVSLVFAFLLLHPVSYIVNGITSILGLVLAIIATILGIIANRIETSFKSKFSIIVGMIAVLLAIVSILLMFLILG